MTPAAARHLPVPRVALSLQPGISKACVSVRDWYPVAQQELPGGPVAMPGSCLRSVHESAPRGGRVPGRAAGLAAGRLPRAAGLAAGRVPCAELAAGRPAAVRPAAPAALPGASPVRTARVAADVAHLSLQNHSRLQPSSWPALQRRQTAACFAPFYPLPQQHPTSRLPGPLIVKHCHIGA